MFPARAGMNRLPRTMENAAAYVPRASGDEPTGRHIPGIGNKCSPRERG